MAMKTGLWIDHRLAVIVTITDEGANTKLIKSNVEKHVRAADPTLKGPFKARQVPADDRHEREFTEHIKNYYNEIIKYICNSEAILIFGPGEAKNELKKQLEKNNLAGRVAGMETADRMTDHQIMAKVCTYFQVKVPDDKNGVESPHQRMKASLSSPSGQI
jgi:stalled ribosome rescue protein Dom34